MPFLANGTYVPPTGAENAAPGEVIKSSVWNTIFTDISAALTTLGQASPVTATPTTLTAPGNYTVSASDRMVLVQANVGTIVMPSGTVRTGNVVIAGATSLNFGTNKCVLLPTAPDTFSGLSQITLGTNYQSIALYALASGGYLVIS